MLGKSDLSTYFHQKTANCPCCNPSLHIMAEHWTKAFISRRLMLLGSGSLLTAIAISDKGKALAQAQKKTNNQPTINQAQVAETIYQNGQVITINEARPTADAIAVKDGKILAVGTKKEIEKFQGEATKIINLNGKTIVPGFIDAHGHVFAQGIAANVADLLPPPDGGVNSIAKIQHALKQWSNKPIAKTLGFIIGNGYDDSQLAECRHPNRDELDAVSTEVPIVAVHQSGHLSVYNSKALELIGIDSTTPNPQGGVIQRRSNSQEPNGVMEESAHFHALSTIFAKKVKIDPTQASMVVGLVEKGIEKYVEYGFTTLQEGLGNPGYLEILKLGAAEDRLKCDIPVYMEYLQSSPKAHESEWSSRAYKNHLRVAGGKLVLDGSPQGRTAWLSKPYYKPPQGQPADYCGYPILTDEQLSERLETAFINNFQILVHCNGDDACAQLIKVVSALTDKYGEADRRIVMIHAQTIREDQLDAVKKLGIIPSFFPAHTYYWGDWHRDVTLGPERANRISPTQSALKRGIKFTIHNDSPIVLPNAMRLLWATVNRRTRTNQVLGQDQRITPLEGLKALTIWSAYQHFEENIKGSIEAGKLADFAILSDNPLTIDPLLIKDIVVLETIKEGKTIYQKQGA